MIWNNARLYDDDPTSRLFFQFIDHNITRMVILRCTQKLLARMRAMPVDVADASATYLGDWTANLLRLGHRQVILCVSQHALLPVLLPAKGVADLPTHLPDAVANILDPIGIASSHIAQEIGQMQRVAIARTNNRRRASACSSSVNNASYLGCSTNASMEESNCPNSHSLNNPCWASGLASKYRAVPMPPRSLSICRNRAGM